VKEQRAKKKEEKEAQCRAKGGDPSTWLIYRLMACTDEKALTSLGRRAKAWFVVHRDFNAAKNILWLGIRELRGQSRLRAFVK